jgi:hypothetical protein
VSSPTSADREDGLEFILEEILSAATSAQVPAKMRHSIDWIKVVVYAYGAVGFGTPDVLERIDLARMGGFGPVRHSADMECGSVGLAGAGCRAGVAT